MTETGSMIYQRPDGSWVIKMNSADRPSSVHATLAEAEQRAREMLEGIGGGLLITARGWGPQIEVCKVVAGMQ